MNVERAPSFAIYSCTSNKREMRVKRKIVGLGFKELAPHLGFDGHHVLYYHRF